MIRVIKVVKRWIYGDPAVVDEAIRRVEKYGEASCVALSSAGASTAMLAHYRRVSKARKTRTGFEDIPNECWVIGVGADREAIRIAKLKGFKKVIE